MRTRRSDGAHLAGLCALVLAAGCSRPQPQAGAAQAATPDITMERVTLRNFRGSSLHLVAEAPRIDVVRATMELWAVDAGLVLPETGAALTARTVTGNPQSGHLEGHDGVSLSTLDGLTGRSPSVTYERSAGAQGAAYSDAGVFVSHPRFTHEADGFAVDFAEQRAEFWRPRTVARPSP